MTAGPRRLYAPRPARVAPGRGDVPCAVGGIAVETVREEWLLEDLWWTPEPIRRHYYELALVDGRVATVFRCARSGRWYSQRA